MLAQRPETVAIDGRVQGWLVGSGIDQRRRSFVLLGDLQHALARPVPVVLDAGALDLVGTHTAPTVITPHARELRELLTTREIDASVEEVRAAPGDWAERAATGTRRRGAAEGGGDPHRATPTATATP